MTIQEYYNSIPLDERRKILSIQLEIFDSKKHKDATFVQKECWKEAVQIYAKNNNITLNEV